jgi:uncharacterized membrane protein
LIAYALTASISCDIKEVNAVPGEVLSFSITVKNEEGYERDIRLSYFSPDGLEGRFVYEGKNVGTLRLNSSEEVNLEFQLEIPEDISEGTYFVSLYASGSHTIKVNVKYPDNPLRITSSITGVAVEAGDTVDFLLTLKNKLNGNYVVHLRCSVPEGWRCKFKENEVEVYAIVIGADEERNINLEVETDSSAEIGGYKIRPYFNDQFIELDVRITETHRGEKGEVKLKIVDRDGKGVSSARITAGNYTFYTSAEGEATFEIPPGTYDLRIYKGGYYDKEVKDVEVKAGKTTDLGTIFMEKKAYFAELVVLNPKLTSTLGKPAVFRFRIENRGYADDAYRLSVDELPPGFYAKFRDGEGSVVSEVFVESGESKEAYLEILLPPSAEPGVYSFTLNAVGHYHASRNLTLKLVGEYRISFEPEGGRYLLTAEAGETKEIRAMIRNIGKGVTLTNISVSVEAPQNWKIKVSPSNIPAIDPYESVPVEITAHIPPDTIPSEYKLRVIVKCDQMQESEDLRLMVKERSYAAIIGGAIIIAAIIGVVYIFRKFGRR